MDSQDYLFDLYLDCKLICHLMSSSTSKRNQNYLFNILKYKQSKIYEVVNSKNRNTPSSTMRVYKEYTEEELSSFNGKNGFPAYVAVDGIIYDVTTSPSWSGGMHYDAIAGKNLTKDFYNCHNSKSILDKYPKVGILIKDN